MRPVHTTAWHLSRDELGSVYLALAPNSRTLPLRRPGRLDCPPWPSHFLLPVCGAGLRVALRSGGRCCYLSCSGTHHALPRPSARSTVGRSRRLTPPLPLLSTSTVLTTPVSAGPYGVSCFASQGDCGNECVWQPHLCATGAAAQTNASWAPALAPSAAWRPNGAGQLCYNTDAACAASTTSRCAGLNSFCTLDPATCSTGIAGDTGG